MVFTLYYIQYKAILNSLATFVATNCMGGLNHVTLLHSTKPFQTQLVFGTYQSMGIICKDLNFVDDLRSPDYIWKKMETKPLFKLSLVMQISQDYFEYLYQNTEFQISCATFPKHAEKEKVKALNVSCSLELTDLSK